VTLTRPVGGAIRLLKRSWQAIIGEIFEFSVANGQKQIPISFHAQAYEAV
jgi:hypothetical protein